MLSPCFCTVNVLSVPIYFRGEVAACSRFPADQQPGIVEPAAAWWERRLSLRSDESSRSCLRGAAEAGPPLEGGLVVDPLAVLV